MRLPCLQLRAPKLNYTAHCLHWPQHSPSGSFLGVRHLGMQVVDGEQSVTSARVKASIDEGSRSLIHQCRQGLVAGQHMVPRRCAFPEMTPNHCVYTLSRHGTAQRACPTYIKPTLCAIVCMVKPPWYCLLYAIQSPQALGAHDQAKNDSMM